MKLTGWRRRDTRPYALVTQYCNDPRWFVPGGTLAIYTDFTDVSDAVSAVESRGYRAKIVPHSHHGHTGVIL